jgi:hypothetical protein
VYFVLMSGTVSFPVDILVQFLSQFKKITKQ